MNRFAKVAVLLPLAAHLAGCGATPEGTETDSRAQAQTNEAGSWVSCWVEEDTSSTNPIAQAHPVVCHADETVAGAVSASLVLTRRNTSQLPVGLALEPGETKIITRISNDDFPVDLAMHVAAADTAQLAELAITDEVSAFAAHHTIADLTANASAPVRFAEPLGVWTIEIERSEISFALDFSKYAVDTGSFRAEDSAGQVVELHAEPELDAGNETTHTLVIARPARGSALVRYAPEGGRVRYVRVTGSGTYAATADGFETTSTEPSDL